VAATPAPKPFLSVGGQPIITKAPGGWWVDNTTVTLYGHVDVSGDVFNVSVYDQGTKFGIASNGSYFGIRARHNLAPYGFEGYAFLAQFESQVDVASSPTEKAAFGTRDSFVGIEGPYGTIKAGKADTPYKKSTAAFDPFANRRHEQRRPDRDHDDRGRRPRQVRVAELDPERGENPADDSERRRQPEAERDRTPRVAGAGGCDHDRRQRQHAGAEDRQHSRGKGERQGQKQVHIAALRTPMTASREVSQDMRLTSLPPL